MKPYLYAWIAWLRHKGLALAAGLSTAAAAGAARQLAMSRPHRIEIGHPDRITILLVGTGGTGGYAAHILAQLAHWGQAHGQDIRLYFIDPDRVETKNLVRQNFCAAEVGQAKAMTLAWRYSAAFGINIIPVVDRFSARMLEQYKPSYSPQGRLTLVIGAVDNVQARRDIATAVTAALPQTGSRDRLWWIDAGNERLHGQVLAGNSLELQPQLSPLGFCSGVPLPHIQEPGLLQARPRPAVDLSCAELTLLGEQSAVINRAMANWIGVYLYRLLQSRDLDLMATYVNLRTGSVRSATITTGVTVRPPLRPPRPVPPPEPVDAPDEDVCDQCGGELVEGQDELVGVLVNVRFCTACDWRLYLCPECHAPLEFIRADQTLVCSRCDWTPEADREE